MPTASLKKLMHAEKTSQVKDTHLGFFRMKCDNFFQQLKGFNFA